MARLCLWHRDASWNSWVVFFRLRSRIDVSPDMLALAGARCPRARLIRGDVTTTPGLAPGPFDLITAFRFFLNAEPFSPEVRS